MQLVYDSYGVRTRRDLVRAVRDEYTTETGTRHTLLDAELMLDGIFEAAYQRAAADAVVIEIRPGTPEWEASEIALARQRRYGG